MRITNDNAISDFIVTIKTIQPNYLCEHNSYEHKNKITQEKNGTLKAD